LNLHAKCRLPKVREESLRETSYNLMKVYHHMPIIIVSMYWYRYNNGYVVNVLWIIYVN